MCFGRTTGWREDKHNLLYTHVHLYDNPQEDAFLIAQRMRGPSPKPTSSTERVFVIVSSNKAVPEKLACDAAFPANWELFVDGRSLNVKEFEPTEGMREALLNGSQTLVQCKNVNCPLGYFCPNAHLRGSANVANTNPTSKAVGSTTGATVGAVTRIPTCFRVDGMDVPSEMVDNATRISEMLRRHPDARLQWCQKPDCVDGTECTFLHARMICNPGAAYDGLPNFVVVDGQRGESIKMFEPTALFEQLRRRPHSVVKSCLHHPSCTRGTNCVFGHFKGTHRN